MDTLTKLGNLGARSFRSRLILELGADISTFFGLRGLHGVEKMVVAAAGKLLAWSIRLDRRSKR
jgi:hypothetical protein